MDWALKHVVFLVAISFAAGLGAGYYAATGQWQRAALSYASGAAETQHKADVAVAKQATATSKAVEKRRAEADAKAAAALKALQTAPERPAECNLTQAELDALNGEGQ